MELDRKPLLRVAVVSDIQGYAAEYDWGMHNAEKAFRLLASKQPDVLILGGDIADGAMEDAFLYCRQLIDRCFTGKVPVPVACAGNHDYGLGSAGKDPARDEALYRKFAAALGQGPENPYHRVIGGYDFIAMSENFRGHHSAEMIGKLEAELQRAVARDGEKPIFVVTHFLPARTVPGSFGGSGMPELRELFDRYPQVVSFSGHVHYPLEDERNIWQGNFTAIQTSTLSYGCMDGEHLFNACNGIVPFAREAVQCLDVEVFADHLAIHRYNAEDQREIKPDGVWRVEIPYRRESAKYTEARKDQRRAPEFKPGTPVYLRYDYGFLYVIFDGAEHDDFVQFYKIVLSDLDGNGNASFKSETFYASNFYRLDRNRDHRQVLQLPGDSLTPRGLMRAEIYPVESFGNAGRPLVLDFRVPFASGRQGGPDRPQE